MSSHVFADRPPPDPVKLLAAWMEWEKGETPPGRVMSNLKTAGLRELLDALVLAQAEAAAPSE
ncbi:MAG TPA: hypothetical protein VM121_05905 [Acidimicrobiales bacterium]|nr:hypothetical protein [Acidimicrobiales bacterium]